MNWLYMKGGDFGGCAVWERSVAVNKQGILFVAATFGGEEQEVVVLTLRKLTPALVCFGHVYVPVDWLLDNFPVSRHRCQPIVMEALRIVKLRARHSQNAHSFNSEVVYSCSQDSLDAWGGCSPKFSRAYQRKAIDDYLGNVEGDVQPSKSVRLDVRI